MTVYSINPRTYKVESFKSKKHAQQHGNGNIIASTPGELAKDPNASMQILVNVYNNKSKVMTKRFSDKLVAARKIFSVLSGGTIEYGAVYNEKIITDTAPKLPDDVKTVTGKFAGKTIHCLVPYNPRRQATKGFHSMGILINSSKPVAYEDYIQQGGRRQDLQWDLERNHVEIK